MAPVIEGKDLYKCYPGFPPVLRGVNIEVEPGEMAAIMGPSGCGKSTMLHILGMLHAPDSGSLEILGADVLALNREQTAAFRRGNMGFVMQASNLFDHSTVFENVEFPLIYENVPPQDRWERVIRALDLVRLSARVHYRSNRLSGGEQQRVAIARAMVNNPRILLADEPTGALDAKTSVIIMENFRRLCHSGGVSMVMVTHDPKMAAFCDTIYTLEDGVLHEKKRQLVKIDPKDGAGFLRPPEPIVRGALVAARFPDHAGPGVMRLARRLNQLDLLSRIYSLGGGGFLGSPKGYSLPLAVRHAGFGAKSKLVRWAREDEIQFLFAANAGKAASMAAKCAKKTGLPHAFRVTGEDLARAGAELRDLAAGAAFVACPSASARERLLEICPDLAREKVLLLRERLLAPGSEDEIENVQPPRKDQPAAILCPGPDLSLAAFSLAAQACGLLKKRGLNFRLDILGAKSWKARSLLRRAGTGANANFLGAPEADSLGEIFRASEIFVAGPPNGPGADLLLPWPLCEAMAFGLGIVCLPPGPGMAEALRNGENCLVAGDRDRVAAAMEKLISNPAGRKSLGEAARGDIIALLDTDAESRRLCDLIIMASGAKDSEKLAIKI